MTLLPFRRDAGESGRLPGQPLTRREFLGIAAVSLVRPKRPSKIERIEHQGVLISECSLAGERRKDNVVPAHPNGIPVSANRWLMIYATRGFSGNDDDRSIVWQLRSETPDGRVLREGLFSSSQANWDPIGDGKAIFRKQLGHPVLFGVPRGAWVGGRPAPSANVFVAKWRRTAWLPVLDRDAGLPSEKSPSLTTQAVEWVQFRLNSAEDDIEIIRPAALLRQKGYEAGDAFCSAAVQSMNQTFVQAVPYNSDGTEWADCNHFEGGRLACLKYAFNSKQGIYEWVQTGPLFGGGAQGLFEASLAQSGNKWILAARLQRTAGIASSRSGVAWVQTEDPFAVIPPPTICREPVTSTPRTAYVCADGVLRLFSGDATVSPHRNGRDPLYCWDVDSDDGFSAANRRIIFDSVKAGLPIRRETRPLIDMCKLLPHAGGKIQWIIHRVQVDALDQPSKSSSNVIPAINHQEKAACAIYCAKIVYTEAFPSRWEL